MITLEQVPDGMYTGTHLRKDILPPLMARIAQLEEALGAVEWLHDPGWGELLCSNRACGQTVSEGHTPTCIVGNALKKVENG